MNSFESRLSSLVECRVLKVMPQAYDSHSAGFWLALSDGTRLDSHYWRFIELGKRCLLSSFTNNDFSEDPVRDLQASLLDQRVQKVEIDAQIGDVKIYFSKSFQLQLFHFCRSESWEIRFADGLARNANHYGDVLAPAVPG